MAQPVTPQDHIRASAERVRAQQAAAKQLAIDLAAERVPVDQAATVDPSATKRP